MRIIVDADATPNRQEIINIGLKYKKETILICDDSHQLKDQNATIITVETGSQNTDIKLLNLINPNDIIITGDYGIAIIALSKHCHVISPNGLIYTNKNIDTLIQTKYLLGKLRKQKVHIKGPKRRTEQINKIFLENLEKIIKENT